MDAFVMVARMKSSNQQLLLVRYFFEKGRDTLASGSPFSAGHAVSMFHDAVESLLWAVIVRVEGKPSEKFEAMWDAIAVAPKAPAGKVLPLRSAMLALNKARVNFKHYGNLPDSKDAQKFMAYTEEFLEVVTRDFFGHQIQDVHMVDMIADETVAGYLRYALAALADLRLQEAVENCARANYVLTHYVNRILPPLKKRRGFDEVEPFDRENEWDRAEPEVQALAEEVRNLKRAFSDVRGTLIAAALKLPVGDIIRFQSILLPDVYNVAQLDVIWPMMPSPKEGDVTFLVNYLTRFAIALEASISEA